MRPGKKKAEADPWDIILVRAIYKCWYCLIYLKLNSGHLAKILVVNQHSGWCFLCHATFAKLNDWQVLKVTCLVRLTFNQSCFGSWNWCLSMALTALTLPTKQNASFGKGGGGLALSTTPYWKNSNPPVAKPGNIVWCYIEMYKEYTCFISSLYYRTCFLMKFMINCQPFQAHKPHD